ncbi:MAG: DUF1203 domain-containing protein [Pseudomonadota bacterium]
MTLRYIPIDTETARAIRAGAPDANGQPAERAVSDGSGNPCRHCLCDIPEGEEMLILALRPFPEAQPYAETGPIFLCAKDCAPWQGDGPPPVLTRGGEDRLVKGYDAQNRIVYGLGRVVPVPGLDDQVARVLADPRVVYAHIRSSTNNCFTCWVERD